MGCIGPYMGRRVVNLYELGEQIRAGKNTQEIAEHFGVTDRAIQRNAKKFGLSVTRNAVMHQASRILQQDLDAREQLLKINLSANRLLDMLENQLQQIQGVDLGILVDRLEALRAGMNGEGEVLDEIIAVLKSAVVINPSIIDQLLRIYGEIRQQIALGLKVVVDINEMNWVNEVHKSVLEEIGVESPECKSRIIRRLQGHNLLLTAVRFA